jgi:hypothetical protein
MPEDTQSVDAEAGSETDKTVLESEYKSLQRKLGRRDSKVIALERTTAQNTASLARIEEMLANSLHLINATDDERGEKVPKLLSTMSTRRTQDISTAQTEAEISQVLDLADTDWDDDRLTEARLLREERDRTGNATLDAEILRRAREALQPAQSTTSEEAIKEIVSAAILKDRQDHGRVDTGQSVSTGKVSVKDLTSLNPRIGIKAMKEANEKALDSLGI